jgi:hypothetical protein
MDSARLGWKPNEVVYPVNAHHRNICRYPSEKNQTYILVEDAIIEIISKKVPSLALDNGVYFRRNVQLSFTPLT